jgi:threonine aldolase
MAAQLAAAFGDVPAVEVMRAPQSNSVFARIPPQIITPLQDWSFFWPWDPHTGMVRWMTSFATTDDDVSRFVAGVRYLTDSPAHGHSGTGVEQGVSA